MMMMMMMMMMKFRTDKLMQRHTSLDVRSIKVDGVVIFAALLSKVDYDDAR